MTTHESDLRVLVVAPSGRDGPMICELLAANGIASVFAADPEMARHELHTGAGAVVLAEEVLTLPVIAAWGADVSAQASWSDLPLILLTIAGAVSAESRRKALARQPMGNLVLLERPVRPETLISTVEAALRSRRRQYQVRDFIAEQQAAEETLRKAEKLAVSPSRLQLLACSQQSARIRHEPAVPHRRLVIPGENTKMPRLRRGSWPGFQKLSPRI